MKPPRCSICGAEPDSGDAMKDFDLIYFAETDSDKAWYKRMEEIHGVGHPPNAVWFCKKHYKKALKYKHLSKAEAFKFLLKESET